MPWAVITAVGDCLMGRIRDAIGVLFNGLPAAPDPEPLTQAEIVEGPRETIEKFVPSGDGMVSVFIAKSRSYESGMRSYAYSCQAFDMRHVFPGGRILERPQPPVRPEWCGRAYLSCSQAFDECGEDAELTNAKAFIDDGKAYVVIGLKPHDLAPKPKAAKGKRAK